MNIPLVDLNRQYRQHKEEMDIAISKVIDKSAFIGNLSNPFVKSFEEEFAKYIGANHCIACGNGTDSIEILLQAMGIGHGDEVIVPAISWIATSEAVSNVGAKPVFVDIEENHFCMNPELIRGKITKKTKAIIPVHLYGHPRLVSITAFHSFSNGRIESNTPERYGDGTESKSLIRSPAPLSLQIPFWFISNPLSPE